MKDKIQYFIFAVVAIILILTLIYTNRDNKRIKANHEVICATILSINFSNQNWHIEFEYNYKGKTIETNNFTNMNVKTRFNLGVNHIWIVVEKNKPYNYKLLQSKEDFVDMNITSEDTVGKSCISY